MKPPISVSIQPPVIPVAETDGLIKLSDLTHDVAMNFPVWEGAQPTDAYQLAINGQAMGEPIPLPRPIPEETLNLTIPLSALQAEGIYQITYRITNYPSGYVYDSPATIIWIDRTRAGAGLLAPLIFPQINFGEALTAHVPGYSGMAVGDTLQTLCNGTQGPIYSVNADDLDANIIKVSFSHTFLRGLNNDQIEFTYHVTDRAGNLSHLARPVILSMPG